MYQLKKLYETILNKGEATDDRTGVGTISYFGYQMKFDLSEGFPLATAKKMNFKSISSELIWMLEGSMDERRLAELRFGRSRSELKDKRTIWTDNADAQGVALGYKNDDKTKLLGPIYGAQWRGWQDNGISHDQIADLIKEIKQNPTSRRLIVSAWNVGDIPHMALPPCHTMWQMKVLGGKLHCQLYQRSGDAFLGVPYNIASYALLTHLIANETGYEPGVFTHTLGDAHIYKNHVSAVEQYFDNPIHELPELVIDPTFKIKLDKMYDLEDVDKIKLANYTSEATIHAEMAV